MGGVLFLSCGGGDAPQPLNATRTRKLTVTAKNTPGRKIGME
jgi:hypothetical protein